MDALDSELRAIKDYASGMHAELQQIRELNALYKRENSTLRSRVQELEAVAKTQQSELEMLREKDVQRDGLIHELTQSVQESQRVERKREAEESLQVSQIQQSSISKEQQELEIRELSKEVRRLAAADEGNQRLKGLARELAMKLVSLQQALLQPQKTSEPVRANSDPSDANKEADKSSNTTTDFSNCPEAEMDADIEAQTVAEGGKDREGHDVKPVPELELVTPGAPGTSNAFDASGKRSANHAQHNASKSYFERSRQVNASTAFLEADLQAVVHQKPIQHSELEDFERRDAIAEAPESARVEEFSVGDLE